MIYLEFPARTELRDHIECFWTITAAPSLLKTPTENRILPDGCMDIIFDFKDSSNRFPAYVVGTMSHPLMVPMAGFVDLLGIRFKPGAIQPFLSFFAAECTDQAADLSCFWGPRWSEVWNQLRGMQSTQERISFLELDLLKNFGWRMGLDPYVQYCVKQIQKNRGNTPLNALERGTGLSARQLERKFARDIGLGPKTFSRIIRFQNIVQTAQAAKIADWAGLATELGYADQSHLVREFREFSGTTPLALIAAH